jgi:hypothetical protein
MRSVGEMIDSSLEFAIDVVTTRNLPHYIGERITDATLNLLRDAPKENHDQAAAN